ncbi:MAG: hypothetical protein LUD72_04005 [Bacteroidales bacterium]|nr:hypothetical protein [Bacteroidales bacterium]
MANNATNVSVGKPKTTGSIHVAPYGSTLPTSASAALDSAFVDLGYVSEDGLTNSNSPESSEIKAWGGDTVYTTQTGKEDIFSFALIESKNVNVLKAIYGEDNVEGDIDSGIVIKANASETPEYAWVIDMIMRDDVPKRIVIPCGKITDVGDISYTDEDAIGYDVTVTANPDEDGNTHYEYIGGAEATPTSVKATAAKAKEA